MKIGYFFASDPYGHFTSERLNPVRDLGRPAEILKRFVEAGCQDVVFYYSCRAERSAKKGEEMARYLTERLKPGDTVVIDNSFFDLGFKQSYFPEFARRLRGRGIHLMSLDGRIDTKGDEDADSYLEHLYRYFEDRAARRREETLAGMARAEKLGRKGGRRRVLSKDDLLLALAMIEKERIPVAKVAEKLKVSRRTLYRYVKERSRPGV